MAANSRRRVSTPRFDDKDEFEIPDIPWDIFEGFFAYNLNDCRKRERHTSCQLISVYVCMSNQDDVSKNC